MNGKGEVDSSFVRERLRKDVSEKIVKNIYDTKGHWHLSQQAKATDHAWYIFPYFDLGGAFGPTSKCSEKEKALQQAVMKLSYTLSAIQREAKQFKAISLRTSINGGGLIKM